MCSGAPAAAPAAESGGSVRLPITFTAPGPGFVSLALYDQDGVLVRSLLYAEPVEKGSRVVPWDGTTDLGLPAKSGDLYCQRASFLISHQRSIT
jgi:hypothetical protein